MDPAESTRLHPLPASRSGSSAVGDRGRAPLKRHLGVALDGRRRRAWALLLRCVLPAVPRTAALSRIHRAPASPAPRVAPAAVLPGAIPVLPSHAAVALP